MTVKRSNSGEAIQFADDNLNNIDDADLDESGAHDMQVDDDWDVSLAEGLEEHDHLIESGFPDLDEESLEVPSLLQPKPKSRPLHSHGGSSSSSSIQVDPLVSRSIDKLVQDRLADSVKTHSSFLDSMALDSAFSMDRIWKMPQMPDFGRFETLSAAAAPKPVQGPETLPTSFQFRKKRLLATSFARSDDQLEMNALRKLREIVLFRPQDSRLGRALMDIAGRLVPEETIRTSFSDCVAGKAPGTIAKRVADYHRFARWAVETGRCGPMQLTEPILYEYAQHMKTSGASATSLQSFLKAIGFFEHHIGFADCDVAFAISGRVSGVSKTMLATKRELQQAPPMTADDVYKLEKHVCTANDKDACIGGFFLFTLYASARFADAARATSVRLDMADHIALLESSTLKFKTASTAGNEMRNVALPMLALGSGLYQASCWGEAWLKARKSERLDHMSCLMPAWSEVSMCWLQRPMTSGEGLWFLREMLVEAGIPESQALQYSTHTLKSTCLSWAATSGAMDFDQRRIMGRHFDSRLAMPLLYSRDALAEIQTKLWRILKAVRDGLFDPDASRAQRIANATMNQDDDDSAEEVISDESCEPEDLELSEHLRVEEPIEDSGRKMISKEDFETCLQHTLSGVIHAKLDSDTLACSRKISKNFVRPKCKYDEVGNFPFCSQCATHVMP